MNFDNEHVVLKVNINSATAEALKQISLEEGVTITEAVRRAIGVYAFIRKQIRKGRAIHVVKPGRKTRELIL